MRREAFVEAEDGLTGVHAVRGEQRRRTPRPDRCRPFARRVLAEALPAILERFIEEATKGSIPHAKALMTMAGMDREEAPAAKAPARKRVGRRIDGGGAKTLSELLLLELRRGSETVAEPTEECT